MPRKKKSWGFTQRKDRGQHLRRGYIPKYARSVISVTTDQQDGNNEYILLIPGNQLPILDDKHEEKITLESDPLAMTNVPEMAGCFTKVNVQDMKYSCTKSEPSDTEISGSSLIGDSGHDIGKVDISDFEDPDSLSDGGSKQVPSQLPSPPLSGNDCAMVDSRTGECVKDVTYSCTKAEPNDTEILGGSSIDGNNYDIGNVLVKTSDFEGLDPLSDQGIKQDPSESPVRPTSGIGCAMAESCTAGDYVQIGVLSHLRRGDRDILYMASLLWESRKQMMLNLIKYVTEVYMFLCSNRNKLLQNQPTIEAFELNELLQKVRTHVNMFLPPHWLCAVTGGKLALGFAAPVSEVPFAIQRSMFITPAGEVKIFVHNKLLPSCHKLWKSVKNICLLPNNVQVFCESILNIANALRSYIICAGTQDHEHAWTSCDLGFVDENHFSEARYSKTFRSSKCLYLVDNFTIKRCQECNAVKNVLRQRKQNQTVDPPDKKPDKYLTTLEMKIRLSKYRKTIRNLRDQNERLKLKMHSSAVNEKC